MKITIVYDNEAQPPFKSDWGFACFIEIPETTLIFDTGSRSDLLLYNMGKLGLITKEVDAVVLSHNHGDHTGGLKGLLAIKLDLSICKPTFSRAPKKLFPGVMTTGTLGDRGIQEQSLVCTTDDGLVVITGCSHPGLENILKTAREFGEIYAVIGGFHGFNKFNALKGISLIVPCHCTSNKQEIQQLFPEAYHDGGVGKKFVFKD